VGGPHRTERSPPIARLTSTRSAILQILLSLGLLALLVLPPTLLALPQPLIRLNPANPRQYPKSVASFNPSDYVAVFNGDMPLMFAVGHGGWKQVGDLQNGSSAADPLLRDYFYEILAVRIYERTGHLPYVIFQQGNRNYVNTNGLIDDPSSYHPDNAEARAAYFEFHNHVNAMIGRIEARYGADMALMINPHTTSLPASRGDRPWDRIADIGFIASVTNLGSTANTMKALYDRRGEVAMRGEDSIPYQLFHGQDWPTPGAVWPEAATVNSKTMAQTGDDVWHVLPAWVTGYGTNDWVTAHANGGRVVRYHGTNTWGRYADWPNGLDAFQIEIDYTKDAGIALDEPGAYQLDVPFTTSLMDDFIDAILHSLAANYNWTPGGVTNVLVDNGDAGFNTTGDWVESSGKGYWGTPSIYTTDAGATATWRATLPHSGTYQVFTRWTKVESRTHDARYTINHACGSRTVSIDQSGDRDAKWVSLGIFEFDPGTSGHVVLECTDANTSTSADAVLFRLVHLDRAGYLPLILRGN